MKFRKPIAVSACFTLGVALVVGHDEKHTEQNRCQEPATLTHEGSYSTIAPPMRIDYGLIEFDRYTATLVEQPHDHGEVNGDSIASTAVEISASGAQRKYGNFTANAVLKKVGQGSFSVGATLVRGDGT